MSPALPDGEPAPDDGTLPESASQRRHVARDFGVYLHVPFCTVRCGYCDFNTYTATELGGGASQDAYADTALREIALAAGVMERAGLPARPVSTVFVGGGTPTRAARRRPRRACSTASATRGASPPGAEVTTEANPDSVDARRRSRRSPRPASRASRSACSRPSRTCSPRSSAPTTRGAIPRRRALGARRRARRRRSTSSTARRGSRSTTGAPASRPRSRPASTTSPRTRSSSRPARAWPRRCAAASSSCPTATTRPTKYELADDLLAAAGLELVRGEQLGADRTAGRLPAQPRLLAGRRLVGHRTRRALVHQRRGGSYTRRGRHASDPWRVARRRS